MSIQEILKKLEQTKVLQINEFDLKELLNSTSIVREEDSVINDYLRILDLSGTLVFQENDNKGNILIRKIESIETGNKLLESRRKIYENMWNGCGCKIDYYD
ncbi:MAG TPA: hypothetical protein PKA80_10695 [Ignavibacteriaceae bacterium]|nr:hypothetical protein [Ignavibacteriaceae bacterium]